MPRHYPPTEGDEWWGCDEPERPDDPFMCIDVEHCHGCRIKAVAVLAIEGDSGAAEKLWYDMADDEDDDAPGMTLTQLLAVFAQPLDAVAD